MSENQNQREILLVDDDANYTEVIRMRLEASGYRVACVSNGREALELLEHEYQPRLIILDLDMPDKNGLTTLIDLKIRGAKKTAAGSDDAKIPVIIATGLESPQIRKIIADHHVSGYLQKHYESEDLIRTVKQIIG